MNLAVEKKEGADLWTDAAPQAQNALIEYPIISQFRENNNIETARFLSLLTDEEEFTFQTFDDKKERRDPKLTRIMHGTLDQHFGELARLNQAGAGVFVTINATDLHGREARNIKRVRAVFVDLDGASLAPILKGPLEPHIIIATSSGRFHVYWVIEDLPLEAFTPIQKALIKRFQADPAVHDLSRVMRMPGFYHHKDDPFLVRIFSNSGTQPYQTDQFINGFGIDLKEEARPFMPKLGLKNDPILMELNKRGMVKRSLPSHPGGWDILCPFAETHTTGEDGTAYFEAHTNGYKGAGFKCQHAHCSEKGIDDIKNYLGITIPEEVWDEPIPLVEELLPVMSYESEMLPEALRSWIMDISERMQVPLDFLAIPAIVALGAIIGRKIGICPKAHDDWLVVPNLWGAIVGRSAFLKSPSIAEVLKPLDELAEKTIQKHSELMAIYDQQLLWLDAQKTARKEELKKAARKQQGQDMPDMPVLQTPSMPQLKRYKTEDGTVEKIGEILLHNPQGILVHRDELTGWFKGLEKYGHEGDRAFYLEAWNGNGAYTIDRIGRGTLHIKALCLSMIGGIQPGPLREYVHQAVSGGSGDDGLLQRFQLLVWPDPLRSWENIDRLPNFEAKEQAYRLFYKLDAFEPFEPCVEGAFKMHALHFSPEAQKYFNSWRYQLEHKLRDGSLAPALESHFAKYRFLMPKLALIFCLIDAEECFPPREVDVQATLRAIKWCEYLETHARRLYAAAEAPGMESARALLERIQAGDVQDGFTIRSVYHSRHWSKLDTLEKVTNGIKILEECGWVRCETIKSGGRPSPVIRLHPCLKKRRLRCRRLRRSVQSTSHFDSKKIRMTRSNIFRCCQMIRNLFLII